MPTNDIIEQIISMPQTLKENKDLSVYEFLKKIGYFQEYDKVSEKQIYLKLAQFPERIDEWIQHSEDQRSDQHYLIMKSGLKWVVKFWSSRDETLNTSKTFTDKVEACANFIFSRIEYVRKLFP
jgi:hypothetical protein